MSPLAGALTETLWLVRRPLSTVPARAPLLADEGVVEAARVLGHGAVRRPAVQQVHGAVLGGRDAAAVHVCKRHTGVEEEGLH